MKQDTFLIGLFYSPTTADSVFFDSFNANIEKASEISNNLILVGDLNEDLLNMTSGECYNVLTPFCQLSRKLSLKFAALK